MSGPHRVKNRERPTRSWLETSSPPRSRLTRHNFYAATPPQANKKRTQRPLNKHKWERRIHTNCQRTRLGRIICVCRCLPIPPTSAWFNVRQGSFPSLRPWPCRFPHPPPPPPPLPQVVMCDMMSISFALDQQLSWFRGMDLTRALLFLDRLYGIIILDSWFCDLDLYGALSGS